VDGTVKVGGGTSGIDYRLLFDGFTGDGTLTWMENENYFETPNDVIVNRLIIRSADTHKWAITVSNLGLLTTTDLGV
jgi:hypothetical protein